MAEPIVRVEELSFRYALRRQLALEDLSFSIAEGEMVLLLGPSGSGKSTLSLCLNGLIPHSIEGELSGEVWIAGQRTLDQAPGALARKVGVVFQDPESQFTMLTVEEEIAFGLENLSLPREEMEPRIEEALRWVRLEDARRARLDRLSGGMKQRVALAAILAMGPSLLILDEPTSNLDPQASQEFFDILARLRGRITSLLIEHRLDPVVHLMDRVLVLSSAGRLLTQGPPREIFAQEDLLSRHGLWAPQVVELAHRLRRHGLTLAPYPPLTSEETIAALEPYQISMVTIQEASIQDRSNPPRTGEPAVVVHDLSFAYPNGTQALHGVEFELPSGTFAALVGPNAAGKTTLAYHLSGVHTPPKGRVFILGSDAAELSATELSERIGYVFQNPEHQFVTQTVFDELAFSLRARGLPEAEVTSRVEELLEEFHLSPWVQANPFNLSQGQKRRLSVATMLAAGQRILVLDEPAFGQDRKSALRLMERLRRLHRQGITLLMITHDMRLVAEYAEVVLVMLQGRMVLQGTPRELFQRADLLAQASLLPPPLWELSRRLRERHPEFPLLLTVEEFEAALVQERIRSH